MKCGVLLAALLILPFTASAATVQPPSCVISTPPGAIQPGATARLIWYTENATKASINGIGEVPLQSTRDVRPTQTTTYVMTVTNSSASRTCAVIVTVAKSQAQTQSLLYYNSPQPYVYSPNQIFWSPIYVPPKYVNGNYVVTDEWYEDAPRGYSGLGGWYDDHAYDSYGYGGDIDSQYIPGSSYTLTSWYTMPSGNSYMIRENCVAGLDCITTGTGYGYQASSIHDVPEDKVQAYLNGEYDPDTRNTSPSNGTLNQPAPLIVIPPSAGMTEDEWLRAPNANPHVDMEPDRYSEPPSVSIPAAYHAESEMNSGWTPLPVTNQYNWSPQNQTQYDMYGEDANPSWDI